jgi:hypothetical protein
MANIDKCKQSLDESPIEEQVKKALIQLNKLRGNTEEQQLLYDLIINHYAPNWSASQRQYFCEKSKLIRCKYVFFFSFTTKHFPREGENPINSRYEYFIKKILGRRRFRTADHHKCNLLAEALYHLLSQSHSGFIFTQHENDNRELPTKLKEACAQSMVFVQIVQNIMFKEPRENRTNYCFFEYEEMSKTIPKDAFVFVVAENSRDNLVRNEYVPPIYDIWHKHIWNNDTLHLEEVREDSAPRIRALIDRFDKNVIQKVTSIVDTIFKNVPSDS